MKTFLFTSFLSLILTSCSFYSAKNYNIYYLNLHKTSSDKFKPTKRLSSYDYTENNMNYFKENGYVMIGYDAIRHTYIGYQEAVNAGCWLGATVMLYKHQYVGTASGTAVVPFYNQGETYTVNSRTSGSVSTYGSGTASAFGSGGYAYGSSFNRGYGSYNSNTTTTITTPGSFSYYSVPYSNDYCDQYAFYFAKKFYRVEQNIDLFQKASYSSSVILKIKENEWFEVLSWGDKYNKIRCRGKVGYIIAAFSLK